MLQRPGCFIVFAVAALLTLGVIANAVNPAPREAAASFADRQQIAPTPSATTQQTATPDALATTAASSAATNAEAQASIGNTQSANGTHTAIAETQTPASWTATAVNMRHEIDAAERDQALLGAQLLAETLTMAPTSAWMTDVARWPTAQAEQTQAAFNAQQADKQRGWDALMQTLWALALAAIPVALIVALIASAVVMPSALSWRLQGVTGGQAQAVVDGARLPQGRQPIPTTNAGAPAEPLDPHTRTERLALRVLGRMARPEMGGPDAPMLTSAPVYGDNRSRDVVRDALIMAGLAQTTNGVGVELADDWTVGSLAAAIATGAVRLNDPPTPAA